MDTKVKEGNRFRFFLLYIMKIKRHNINRINNTLIKFNSVVEVVVFQMVVAEWMVLDVYNKRKFFLDKSSNINDKT